MSKKIAVSAIATGVLVAFAMAGQLSPWSPGGLLGCWVPSDELVQYRTENSKTFDNHDGTWSTVVGGVFHRQAEDGRWAELTPEEYSSGQETGELDAEVTLTSGGSTSWGYNMWYIGTSASYFRCQHLYLSSEMGALALGGTITDIAFNHDPNSDPYDDTMNTSEQWLGDVTYTEFTSTAWETPGTLVYSGNLITTGTGWISLHLTTPFDHTAGQNLLISYRHQDGSNEAAYKQYQASYVGSPPARAKRGRSLTTNPPTMIVATSRAVCRVTYTPPPGTHVDNLALTPSYPWAGEVVAVTAKVYDDLAPVDSALLFHSLDRVTWTRVVPDSSRASDSTYFFAIPGRTGGDSLHCYVRAWSQTRSASSITLSRKIPRDVSIYQIQFCDTLVTQNSAWRDSFVHTAGVVTGTVTNLKFYLGQATGGPWSGLFIHNGLGTVVGVGDSLDIVGRINEANNVTIDTAYRIEKRGARPCDTTKVSVSQARTELFEGVLLRSDSVCLKDTVGNFTAGSTYWLYNIAQSESVVLYVYPNSNFAQTQKPNGIFTLISNGHHYGADHELVPRYPSDIIPIIDVQALQILDLPATMVAGDVAVPRLEFRNASTTDTARNVLVTLTIGSTYIVSQNVTALAPSETDTLTFSAWTAYGGVHTAVGLVSFANDPNHANDTVRQTVTVSGSTTGAWAEQASMPDAPSSKKMKDGGWLAYDASRTAIYAAKGNKTPDFYAYYPTGDSWKTLNSWPLGIEGKSPGKGAAACADANGVIYATKGNNTAGFWKYDATKDSWYQKAGVPLGPSNKKVKGGTDVAYVDKSGAGYVYLLKGYKAEFWRYDIAGDSWQQLTDAPHGANAKWDKGSWLAYDDANKMVYAHKAKYHEFYTYSAASDSWQPGALTAMPTSSRSGRVRKAKDGACGTWLNGHIYAFKGANTQELWRYFANGDSWQEIDTIPSVGRAGARKRIKGGADLVTVGSVIYGTKGNKCNELWKYTPFAPFYLPAGGREGVAAERTATGGCRFAIAPNPVARGRATLRFPSHLVTPTSIRIYDASGRLVYSALAPRTQTFPLDLRSLAAGVYLVRLSGQGLEGSQKFVVRR